MWCSNYTTLEHVKTLKCVTWKSKAIGSCKQQTHPASHFVFALCSKYCSSYFFLFFLEWLLMWLGHLTDRYECLLWQENCCTIFLYWGRALSLPPPPYTPPRVGETIAVDADQSCIIVFVLFFLVFFLFFFYFSTWTTLPFCERWAVVDPPTMSCRSHPLLCDSRPFSLCSILSAPSCESWRYMFLCKKKRKVRKSTLSA